jgi:hypothetical protein
MTISRLSILEKILKIICEHGNKVMQRYLGRGNWAPQIGMKIIVWLLLMLSDGRSPFVNPTIQPRWYRRGKRIFYQVLTFSLLCVRQGSTSSDLCYVDLTVWTSVGGNNYVQQKYAWLRLKIKTSWLWYHDERFHLSIQLYNPGDIEGTR